MADIAKLPETSSRSLQAGNAWSVLALLFLANTFNFYDRTIPAILVENIKTEFSVSDTQIGLLTAAFTIVYAIVGIPLGRAADTMSRGKIMGSGLTVWSLLTAATGAAWSFGSMVLLRLGVGIGEASYAPAANSMIADLFPANKRARAFGIFQLGLPVGLITAFFTVGWIATAFDSWRAPFYLAAIPGLLLAAAFFFIKEPMRGASEVTKVTTEKVAKPFGKILRIKTLWWLIVAAIGVNIASYSVNSYLVSVYIRFFGLKLTQASILVGVVVGVTGLIGLLAGGWLADKADTKSVQARVAIGAFALLIAAPLSYWAFTFGKTQIAMFTVVLAVAWLLQYLFFTSAYPAVSDVVEPRLRSTAVAIFFAAFYLLGAAMGPVIVGMVSDHFAAAAQTPGMTAAQIKGTVAVGLKDSLMWVTPLSLAMGAIGLFCATRTVAADNAAMKAQVAASAA